MHKHKAMQTGIEQMSSVPISAWGGAYPVDSFGMFHNRYGSWVRASVQHTQLSAPSPSKAQIQRKQKSTHRLMSNVPVWGNVAACKSSKYAQVMWFMFSSCVGDGVAVIGWCKKQVLELSAWNWADRVNLWINNWNYRVLRNEVKVIYAKEDKEEVMEQWVLSPSSPHHL